MTDDEITKIWERHDHTRFNLQSVAIAFARELLNASAQQAEPVAGESRLVTLARENYALLDALVYVAHMMHAEPQHRCCVGLTLIDHNGVEVKLPDGRVVAGYASPNSDRKITPSASPDEYIKQLEKETSFAKTTLEATREAASGRNKGASPADRGEDARDAERYRWLRNSKTDLAKVIDKVVGEMPYDEATRTGGYPIYEYRAGEELDAAIDAAMSATPPAAALADEQIIEMARPWLGGI